MVKPALRGNGSGRLGRGACPELGKAASERNMMQTGNSLGLKNWMSYKQPRRVKSGVCTNTRYLRIEELPFKGQLLISCQKQELKE